MSVVILNYDYGLLTYKCGECEHKRTASSFTSHPSHPVDEDNYSNMFVMYEEGVPVNIVCEQCLGSSGTMGVARTMRVCIDTQLLEFFSRGMFRSNGRVVKGNDPEFLYFFP